MPEISGVIRRGAAVNGPVVQLVRTPPCHGGGREFEPHPGRHLEARDKM